MDCTELDWLVVRNRLINAPHPADTTTPVSRSLITDQLPNRLLIPKTINVEINAPANAKFTNRKLLTPSRIPERAPTAAPPDTPSMYGSANGFLNNTCIATPDIASKLPTANPANVLGMRISLKIWVVSPVSGEVK